MKCLACGGHLIITPDQVNTHEPYRDMDLYCTYCGKEFWFRLRNYELMDADSAKPSHEYEIEQSKRWDCSWDAIHGTPKPDAVALAERSKEQPVEIRGYKPWELTKQDWLHRQPTYDHACQILDAPHISYITLDWCKRAIQKAEDEHFSLLLNWIANAKLTKEEAAERFGKDYPEIETLLKEIKVLDPIMRRSYI